MVRASDFYSEDWGFKSLREFTSIFLGYFYSIKAVLVVSKEGLGWDQYGHRGDGWLSATECSM